MKWFKMLIATVMASGFLCAGQYQVDMAHSYVGFKIKHLMVSNVKGNFDKFSGNLELDENAGKLKYIKGIIKVDSIDTGIAKRDAHLKDPDFFNAKKYPKIIFESTSVDGDTVYGNLTMHGVTKPIELEYEYNGVIKDPRGNMKAGLSLEGKVKRKDFGLTYNKILEAGGVAIGDKVKLEIEIEAKLIK
jgi:polyisoprenoid-binding protein YceI